MLSKPQDSQDLNEMLKRALQAQIELGLGEMVLEPGCEFSSLKNGFSLRGILDQESMETETEKKYSSLAEHNEAICNCQACPLGETRNKFVYGVGNPKADIMFVGEAPGAKEDEIGEPFVGRAGKLLDKILVAMSISRDEVYIANILKCRPPGNRDPQPDEMELCFPYLKQQIKLINPIVICSLGRIAAQSMLNNKAPLGKMRKQWHSFAERPMMVTYHPAALLRNPAFKRDCWEDMQMLMEHYKKLKQEK